VSVAGLVMVTLGKRVFVIGGWSGIQRKWPVAKVTNEISTSKKVYVFEFATQGWRKCASIPISTFDHAASIIGLYQ
jgi:hypothetical protein